MKMITATEWDKLETPNILTSLEIGISVLANRGEVDTGEVDTVRVLGLLKLILDEVVFKSKYDRHRR